jgi:SAM-dependent methyltransferase
MSNRDQIPPSQYIDQFFKRCGLGGQQKSDIFWRVLEKKFGSLAIQLGDCISARENGLESDPYPIKNASFDFANAVASQYDAAKLKAAAIWLLQEGIVAGKVLEIGCDNGILLCLLAEAYPDVSFVGIDPSAPAIEIAKMRASQLNISNIEFKCLPLKRNIASEIGSEFNLVFSVAVFHELLDRDLLGYRYGLTIDEGDSGFSIEDVDLSFSMKEKNVDELFEINHLLTSNGFFISVDRWPDYQRSLKWIRLVENANLSISMKRSSLIEYKNINGNSEFLPATVFFKNCDNSRKCVLPTDVLALHSYKDFLKDKSLNVIEDTLLAELVFGSLNHQELLSITSRYKNDSGTEKVLVGISGGLSYIYTATSRKYRRLVMFPSFCLHEQVSSLLELISARKETCDVDLTLGDVNLFITVGIDRSIFEDLLLSSFRKLK